MKKNPIRLRKTMNILCAVLMLVLLVCQFLPYWSIDGDTASIAGYVWLSEEGNAFTEHFRSTLNDPDFYAGKIVLMNVIMIAAGAIGIISCLFRSEDWQSIIFPGVCGIFGVISYLAYPAYRMGSAWLLHLLLSIGILLLAGSAFFPWLKEKIAERQSR